MEGIKEEDGGRLVLLCLDSELERGGGAGGATMADGALRLRAGERKGGWLEVGGDPDSWAPPVSGRAKKRREERLLGCGGPQAGVGPKAHKRREREKGGLVGCGLRRDRWAGGLRREREVWEGVFFLFIFFKLLFQTFKSFKLFQNFSKIQISLKTFKTPHKQAMEPCIQIMMHKHLSLLKLLK
jgi:hypothetical protein